MDRAVLFELLSLGLLKPQMETARVLCAGEFGQAAGEVLGALGCSEDDCVSVGSLLEAYDGSEAETVYREISREFTRLFVGPGDPLVTPYAGVRAAQVRGQRGLLFVGPESMAVERFMKRCGVAKDLATGQSNDPVDHIGTMCEFCKFLCVVNAHAVVPVEGARVEADDFDCFMADHFVPYATWCASQIRELSEVPFYLAMADMLGVAVSLR